MCPRASESPRRYKRFPGLFPKHSHLLPSSVQVSASGELQALGGGKAVLAPNRPCWAGCPPADSSNASPALRIGREQEPEPRNPNAHTFSPPAPTKPSLFGLGVSRRAHFPPWAAGCLGQPARVVCGIYATYQGCEDMCPLLPSLPNLTAQGDGQVAPPLDLARGI